MKDSVPNLSEPTACHRCLFCRMRTDLRFARVWVCPICRDQLYDFFWASAVQAIVTVAFGLGSLFFVAEEILLFTALVFIKHRIPPPWERGA